VEKILEMLNGRRNVLRKPVNITLATSGIGLSQDKARLLGKNRVFVIVSVDGTKEFNDPVRRMKDGSSSFRVAKNAIMRLKSAGCRFGLSITVSKQNIEHFPQILDTLLSEFSPQDIGLNAFLHRIDNDLNPHQIDSAQAFSAFLEGFRIALKYGIYAEQPLRRFKPFIQRRPLVKDCSAPGERLVLAPGGLMGFCDSAYPERKYFYPYQQFPERTHLDYVKWSGLSSVEMPHCQVCPAMTVCGGACRYDAYKASGKLDGIDKMRCSFELSFLSWLIWRLFDTLKLQDKLFYFPTDSERRSLLENLADLVKNQPFTAGSLIDWN
jgi:radical SAM protein with 4Fe4S-binding SPASM domain